MQTRIEFAHSKSGLTEAESSSRKEDNRFYASKRWRNLRRMHLTKNPLCDDCYNKGCIQIAEQVHHIVERKVDPSRALDPTNLQSLCIPCHNRKRSSKR